MLNGRAQGVLDVCDPLVEGADRLELVERDRQPALRITRCAGSAKTSCARRETSLFVRTAGKARTGAAHGFEAQLRADRAEHLAQPRPRPVEPASAASSARA